MNGKLITFEGIDGSGKSTLSKMVFEEIKAASILTVEPTETVLGDMVNQAMTENLDALTIALLFVADRREHIIQMIKWMNKGKIVLCDRFSDSTFAYQKEHLKINDAVSWLEAIQQPFIIKPDLTFLLLLPPEKALMRISQRKKSIFEYQDFLQRVQQNYIEIAQQEPLRFEILNAEEEVDNLVSHCIDVLKKREIIQYCKRYSRKL